MRPHYPTASAIASLGLMTEDQWREERRCGLGGSDIAALFYSEVVQRCGYAPWSTPMEVYDSKVNGIDSFTGNSSTHAGKIFEEPIAQEYARRHPELLVANPLEMVANNAMPWMIANPDRVSLSQDTGALGGVEIKHVRYADRWANGVPLIYEYQVRWYMAVTGWRTWVVFVCIGGFDFEEFTVTWDEEIENEIVTRAQSFWTDHVVTQSPPSLVVPEMQRLRVEPGKVVEVTLDEAEMAERSELELELKWHRKQQRDLEKRRDMIDAAIKLQMGDAPTAIDGDGTKVATWNEHTRNGTPYRKFKVLTK